MSSGFLGYQTTFMLDFVVCALVLIVPLLALSIWQAKRRRYTRHRNGQVALGLLLLAAVTAFEVDVQWLHGGWENIVNPPDAPPRLTGERFAFVRTVLYIHLLFAVTTPLLWGTTITLALRRFTNPPAPGPHSRLHIRLGWLSTLDLVGTAVTGLWFYYSAFVATAG